MKRSSSNDDTTSVSSFEEDGTEGPHVQFKFGFTLEKLMNLAFDAKRRQTTYMIGTSRGDMPVKAFKVPVVRKTPEVKEILRRTIAQNLLFSHLTDEQIDLVVNAMKLRKVPARQVLYSVDDLGNRFYVVERGTIQIMKDGQVLSEKVKGDSFGEVALLYDCRRDNDAVNIDSPADLWVIDRNTFKHIMATRDDELREHIITSLQSMDLLQDCSDKEIATMAEIVEVVKFTEGQIIIEQGDVGNIFYFIVSGTVVSKDANQRRSDAEFGPGDFFGERALMMDVPRQNTVTATSPEVECLALDREAFDHFLAPSLRHKIYEMMGIRTLRSVPLFNQLSPEDGEQVMQAMGIEEFKAGEHIITQGKPGDKFFIIKEGTVQVLVNLNLEPAASTTIAMLQNGDFFGESSILGNQLTNADCVAFTNVECYTLQKEVFVDLFGSLRRNFRRIMRQREQELNLKVSHMALEATDFTLNDLQRVETIGAGSMGRVHLMEHKQLKTAYALKVLMKARVVKKRQEKYVMSEREILYDCAHPFIVTLFKTFQDENSLYFLTEYLIGGELFHLLNFNSTGQRLTANHHRFYAASMVCALEYLHSKHICYRDLKPENILIDQAGYLRLVDFGSAKRVYKKTHTRCGTTEYMAPEIVLHKAYNQSVDYWALGVLVFELIQKRSPFASKNENHTYRNIISGQIPFKEDFPELPLDLIVGLLERKPLQRLGMMQRGVEDIKSHPWFDGFDWGLLLRKQLKAPWLPKIESSLDTRYFHKYLREPHVIQFKSKKQYAWDEEF